MVDSNSGNDGNGLGDDGITGDALDIRASSRRRLLPDLFDRHDRLNPHPRRRCAAYHFYSVVQRERGDGSWLSIASRSTRVIMEFVMRTMGHWITSWTLPSSDSDGKVTSTALALDGVTVGRHYGACALTANTVHNVAYSYKANDVTQELLCDGSHEFGSDASVTMPVGIQQINIGIRANRVLDEGLRRPHRRVTLLPHMDEPSADRGIVGMSRINLLVWAIMCFTAASVLLLTACEGSSSAGAGSSARVPLTAADEQAVAMLGGFGGTWLKYTQYIIRLDLPPPAGANYARAWQSKCREAFTIYETTRGKSPEWLAGLFVHEGQHEWDGCKIGQCWEGRAADAVHCYSAGISQGQCEIRPCI